MKKILLSLIGCLLFVGCGNKNLDLQQINEKIQESNVYADMQIVEGTDLNNMYSIDSNLAEDILYVESTDPNSVDLYLIVKVKDESINDQISRRFVSLELQSEMYNPENAIKVKNRLEVTYNGYDIYIVSDDNEKVLEIIKNS